MALRCMKLLRIITTNNLVKHNFKSTSINVSKAINAASCKPKEYKTEDNFIYLEDPDTFGTLSGKIKEHDELEDEGDIKEQQYLQNIPLKSQKLTTRQYADLIKQYLKHKRIKEAIDVLEIRMLTEDRVKPENYIYNILIGACADVGYTKKAFMLYNDMKRRALKPTGDTYTCLFHACANSPWPIDGLKNAHHLRNLLIEKGIEPNLTNYNAMIKAFGRCGDLATAFKIVDEMVSKKIKIRVHTFNHLLHACIADKATGLRYALLVWRKMLKMREKPNIYTFNLILKCVKECNLGVNIDIEELLISIIEEHVNNGKKFFKPHINNQLETDSLNVNHILNTQENVSLTPETKPEVSHALRTMQGNIGIDKQVLDENAQSSNELSPVKNQDSLTIEIVEKIIKPVTQTEMRTIPNLLSKDLQMQQVLSLQKVHTTQDKFAIVGGQDDFLNEMKSYSVKPNIKVFTQMLPLIEETREAENKLIETMKSEEVKADIDFFNMLIKKRCLRSDYDGAFDVKEMIAKESKYRKKKYPLKKKLKLKANIMTYGVLAMACKTKESAEKLLNEMNEEHIKVNIEILGTLLRQGTTHSKFGYVIYIMNIVQQEHIKVNSIFVKHLEEFNEKCESIIQQDKNGQHKCTEVFVNAYEKFSKIYRNWLKEVDIEQALELEHPWTQFRENYPETVQRQKIEIKQPKKFYKRNRKFVKYIPRS